MKKTYNLTIVVDTETEEVLFFDEHTEKEKPSFTIGEVDVSEYYDEEFMKLLDECYVLGES